MRGSRGQGHSYKDECMCHRCKRERSYLFTLDLERTSDQLLSRGGRTITGSLTDDRGTRGKTIPAAFCQSYDPSTPDLPFIDKSITKTQHLSVTPLFTGGNPLIELVGVTTVKDGQEVNLIHKVKVNRGVRPVKSLLKRSPNFDSFDGIKRQTSRSKEIVREHEIPIDPDVTRLSYNRPNHLVIQAQQEGDLLDLELGLPLQSQLDPDADLS